MRVIAVASLSLMLIAADKPAPLAETLPSLNNPAYSKPAERWETIDEAVAGNEKSVEVPAQSECMDRITRAREATGQPPLLEREPASPEKPHAIFAVDRRQDGCSVMVMMGNPDDIRPLPLPAEGPVLRIPADAAQ